MNTRELPTPNEGATPFPARQELADIIQRNILSRRSVRTFKPVALPEESLERLLKAGNSAPSAGGLQSRKFIPVTHHDDIQFIIEYIFSARVRQNKELFRNVPCILLMCANIATATQRYKRGRLYAIQDATLAGQNIMLMAHALGIGSCWIGQIRERKLVQRFNIGSDYKLIGLIALGYQTDV